MRTRIDIASCTAGPSCPSSIARSRCERFTVVDVMVGALRFLLTIMRDMQLHRSAIVVLIACAPLLTHAQQRGSAPANDAVTILKPARVFDGETMHEGWAVRVKGERIEAVGADAGAGAAGAKVVDLPGTTLTPGLVEGHSHILLHSYNET